MSVGSADTDRSAVQSARHEFSADELRSDPFGFRAQVALGGRAALSTTDAAVVSAALISLDGWAGEVRLIPPGVTATDLDADVMTLEVSPQDAAPDPVTAGDEHTRWMLYTSGTTGEPKAISHTFHSLTRTIASGRHPQLVWGLLYDPNRMAGLQVILQALRSGRPLIAPALDSPLSERVTRLIESGVTALSATPSLWRQILQLPASADWPLEQITLGGEIADQRVLDALGTRFPDARIVHVFASTETGAAFSVSDGLEGFPVTYLADPPRGIRLEIRDDILHVFSPGVSVAGSDGYASTGDIVEVVADRVLFRGRASGVVNVGGSNVWPEVVESILRRHDLVVEAVVSAKPNPLMGNVLVATVTLAPGADAEGAPKTLRSWVRKNAPSTHVPASVTVVGQLGVSATGKVIRE